LVGCLVSGLGAGGVVFGVGGWCWGAWGRPAGWSVLAVVVCFVPFGGLSAEKGDVAVDAGQVRCAGVVVG